MSKDPAFLFYPSDYLSGTMGMTFEEKGAYIELLMLQFNRGHMSGHMIGRVLGQSNGLWEAIKDKFETDDAGLFFNKRLDHEQNKRARYTPYKIASATLGGLISSSNLTKQQIEFVKNRFDINEFKNLKSKEEIRKEVSEWLSICLTIYENENRNENRNININEDKDKKQQIEIIYPFDNEEFESIWAAWNKFRAENKWKKYSPTGERAALSKLKRISGDDFKTACEIILNSIENSWKGLFELKTRNDGKSTEISEADIDAYYNTKYGSGN